MTDANTACLVPRNKRRAEVVALVLQDGEYRKNRPRFLYETRPVSKSGETGSLVKGLLRSHFATLPAVAEHANKATTNKSHGGRLGNGNLIRPPEEQTTTSTEINLNNAEQRERSVEA